MKPSAALVEGDALTCCAQARGCSKIYDESTVAPRFRSWCYIGSVQNRGRTRDWRAWQRRGTVVELCAHQRRLTVADTRSLPPPSLVPSLLSPCHTLPLSTQRSTSSHRSPSSSAQHSSSSQTQTHPQHPRWLRANRMTRSNHRPLRLQQQQRRLTQQLHPPPTQPQPPRVTSAKRPTRCLWHQNSTLQLQQQAQLHQSQSARLRLCLHP